MYTYTYIWHVAIYWNKNQLQIFYFQFNCDKKRSKLNKVEWDVNYKNQQNSKRDWKLFLSTVLGTGDVCSLLFTLLPRIRSLWTHFLRLT